MNDLLILVDNIFLPNPNELFLIDIFEKVIEIIKTIGNFRNLYIIDIDESTLIKKYKIKEGIKEELSEDQKVIL